MRVKASEVIGKKVVSLESGKVVEQIDDILYSAGDKVVKGLLVKPKGMFNEAEVIMPADIMGVGKDAVTVANDNVLKKQSELGENVSNIADSKDYLTKMEVMTEEGTNLGRVVDIIFDVPSGRVGALELSQGGIANVATGTKTVMADDVITVGTDKLIVKKSVEAQIADQAEERGVVGGVKSKAPMAWDDVRAKAGALGGAATSKYQEVMGDPKTQKTIEDVKENIYQTKDDVKEGLKTGSKSSSPSTSETKTVKPTIIEDDIETNE